MPHVVRFLTNDDGDANETDENGDPVWGEWHFVTAFADAPRTLCTGEVFGFGESIAIAESKIGKITCQNCIDQIKFFKSIKL